MKKAQAQLLLMVVVFAVAAFSFGAYMLGSKAPKIKSIQVYYPFALSNKVDPRETLNVADQVLTEYVFGYHVQRSFKKGIVDVLSSIKIDPLKKTLTFTPNSLIMRSDGTKFEIDSYCQSIKASFSGTLHASFKETLIGFECTKSEVIVRLKEIPVNMNFLFTTPEFSIYEPSKLPISTNNLPPTTGPYFVERLEPTKAILRRNIYYPESLVANKIENVELNWQKVEIKDLDPNKHHLSYHYGFAIDEQAR